MSVPMEVEIKLRLPDQAAYACVQQLLESSLRATHAQENYFFDGALGELEAQRVVVRLRFYNGDKKAVITVKGKALMQDGVSRSSEEEEDVDPIVARQYLEQPDVMMAASPLLTQKQKQFNVSGLKALGGFKNLRQEYNWEGLVIELDQTMYEWGTLFEVECETVEPEVVKPKLEAMLQGAGISYSYSTVSKFANFRNKTLN